MACENAEEKKNQKKTKYNWPKEKRKLHVPFYLFAPNCIDFICSILLECKNICPSVTAYRGAKWWFVDLNATDSVCTFRYTFDCEKILFFFFVQKSDRNRNNAVHNSHSSHSAEIPWWKICFAKNEENEKDESYFYVYRRWKYFSWQSFTNELQSIRIIDKYAGECAYAVSFLATQRTIHLALRMSPQIHCNWMRCIHCAQNRFTCTKHKSHTAENPHRDQFHMYDTGSRRKRAWKSIIGVLVIHRKITGRA